MFPIEKDPNMFVKQIQAYNNTSFALCNNGKVFSWGQEQDGKESNQLLGRFTDKTKKRSDLPGLVSIPESYKIKRIKVRDGALLAFLHEKTHRPSPIEIQKSQAFEEMP